MTGGRGRQLGRETAALIALGLCTAALALVCILYTRDHGRVAAIWPANALILAVLLRLPTRAWPAYAAAAVAGYFGTNLLVGDAPASALALAVCNGAEALVAAVLCRGSIGPGLDVTRPRELATLAAAAATAPLASAFGAMAILPGASVDTFVRWYLADALGLFLVTPALLTLAGDFASLKRAVRDPRSLGPLVALAAALAVVFGQSDYSVLFLIFPPLIWCAFALGAAGTSIALLVTTLIAVVATLGGHGATAQLYGDLQTKLTVLQVLLAAITLVTLPLSAALAERRRLDASLRDALAKAHDSEVRYRTLADNATDVIATFDPQTRFTYLSPSIKTVLGYEPEELIGRPTRDVMHPDDYRSSLDTYRAQLAAGGEASFLFEYRAIRKDGAIVWLAGHPRALRDPKTGELTGFLDVVRDVTERRAAALALAESEARYRMLADNASDMVFKRDADGILTYASPSVAKLGYAPEDLVGRSVWDFLHPDDLAAVQGRVETIARTGEVASDVARTFRFRAHDGAYVWVEANPSVVRDETGRPTFITQVRDITARKAFEDALAESEARYRMLADHASDLIMRLSAEATIEYASPSVARLGYTPDELIGRHALDLIHPEDAADVVDRIGDMMTTGLVDPARERIYRVRTKDGAYVWIEGNPSVILDSAGQPIGAVTQLRDVTTRYQAEQALAQSEARYRMLADNASDLVIKVDNKGILTYVSPSIRRLGHEPGDLVGTSPLALVHPDDRDGVATRMLERRRTGVVQDGGSIAYRVLTKDGGHIWVESNSSIARRPDGSMAAIISQLRDVTARHEQGVALSESEARYRLLADHATDIILKVDASDTILYVSPSVRRYGYEPEDLIGQCGLDLTHPDDRAKLGELVGELFRTGSVDPSRDRTYRLRDAAGDYFWVEGSPSLVPNEAGEVEAVISQLRDVSVRVELEAELLAARDDAQAAAATKAEFMANMSHEIRTPLTAVLGFTGLLANRPDLPEEAQRQVERIGAAGEAMLAIVNDILDFSKLEAGLMPVMPRPAQPLAMLENALALFEPQAAAKGLRLTLDAANLPDHASLDPDRVRQVLLNLIGNAVKFTEVGSVSVTAGYADGRLNVAVRDTGAGMDEAQQAKLFQRFSQVDGAATRAGGGTGLGLAISLGLVDAMGGQIGLTSVPGKGSTFAFEIPAPACEAGEGDDGAAQPGVAGLRVLLADDNATNREIAHAVMAQFEIEVTEAANGAEAVRLADALPYDVILLDIRMPVMDGPTAVRRIRSGGPNATTPILAFSAEHELEAEVVDLFDGHIRKPIEVAPLLETLARVTAWEEVLYAAEA